MDLKEAVKAKPETTDALKALKAKAIPKKYREIVEDKKRQDAMKIQGFIWAGLLILVAIAIGLGYLFRIDIVRTLPATAGAYSALGLKVNGTNLEFESYEATPEFKGGRFVITVKAKIRNLSQKPTPVPPVRVRLYDKGLEQFAVQTIGSHGLIIGGKAVKTMVFDVPDPLNMSTSVDLGFDLEALKAQAFHTQTALRGLAKKDEADHGHPSEAGDDTKHADDHHQPSSAPSDGHNDHEGEKHEDASPLRGSEPSSDHDKSAEKSADTHHTDNHASPDKPAAHAHSLVVLRDRAL
jgi:hypothetical protein